MRGPKPISDREIDELQALLDRVPPPLEPFDVSMLDGFLCGVLLQPQRVPTARWLRHVSDSDGRALPPGFDAARLHALVERRHAGLDHAIETRAWFDPWIFEVADDAPEGAETDAADDDGVAAATDAVFPWVAGFATAQELFPALMRLPDVEISAPLALIFRHLAPDDLEDADALLAEIEALEPAADLAEAVEGLVRGTLLLADVARPRR